MEQLKMIRDNSPTEPVELPEGFRIRSFTAGDEEPWCECCIDGELGIAEISESAFNQRMASDSRVKLDNIYFLVAPEGRVAGTVTYQYGAEPGESYIHMVGIVKDYRGNGLAGPLIRHAVREMIKDGMQRIFLTTDDWRIPAIKTYLNCGFVPVINDEEMAERWRKVLSTFS